MKFAVVGGDQRFLLLYRLLLSDGHQVLPLAMETALPPDAGETALPLSGPPECWILPLPCQRGEFLNAPACPKPPRMKTLLETVPAGSLVLAGMPGRETAALCAEHGLELVDYGAREDFLLRNAELTAEGALALLLQGSKSLRESRVLVAGMGRIGSALAGKLALLGASVSVAARSAAARTKAELLGCETLSPAEAPGKSWDFVVNTVPEVIFPREAIEGFAGARLIELASPPYGFDVAAAEALGNPVCLAAGLPGKTAPLSAAQAIRQTLMTIIKERQLE